MPITRVLIDSLTHADAKCENQPLVFHLMTYPIGQPSNVYSNLSNPMYFHGSKFPGSHRRLHTYSDTFCKTREISNFWKNGKIVISVKIRNFFRSRMAKWI